mmetsp:Transcript_50992/g.165082  ORF Transcript_50992/g.165082 Transcript_50992/m.165082 type:complete len:729 (+) Transcript_50992:208-2394(+)
MAAKRGTMPASMPTAAKKLLLNRAEAATPLDGNFEPIGLVKSHYLNYVADSPHSFEWALLRPEGCARGKLAVFDEEDPQVQTSVYMIGALIQEMIWQKSASSLLLSGSELICDAVEAAFSKGGQYEFEVSSMPKVIQRPDDTPEQPFEVKVVKASDLPPAKAPDKEKRVSYYELALKMNPDKAHGKPMGELAEEGFFAIYDALFSNIEQDEADEQNAQKKHEPLPAFGTSESSWSDVSAFYKSWMTFSSRKAFTHENEWNLKEATNRKLRRAMEQQNKKLRQAVRKDYIEEVRKMVGYVQSRDPRYQAYRKAKRKASAEKAERERAERENRKAEEALRKKERKEAQRREENERWQELDADRQARRDRGEDVTEDEDETDSESEEVVVFNCDVCRKTFKSEVKLFEHNKSKKHLQAVQKQKEASRSKEAADADGDDGEEADDAKGVRFAPPERGAEALSAARSRDPATGLLLAPETDYAHDSSDEEMSETDVDCANVLKAWAAGRGTNMPSLGQLEEGDSESDEDSKAGQMSNASRKKAQREVKLSGAAGRPERGTEGRPERKKERAKKGGEGSELAESSVAGLAEVPGDELDENGVPLFTKQKKQSKNKQAQKAEEEDGDEEDTSKRQRQKEAQKALEEARGAIALAKKKEEGKAEQADASDDCDADASDDGGRKKTKKQQQKVKLKAAEEAFQAEEEARAEEAAKHKGIRRTLHCRRSAHTGGVGRR